MTLLSENDNMLMRHFIGIFRNIFPFKGYPEKVKRKITRRDLTMSRKCETIFTDGQKDGIILPEYGKVLV